MNEDDDFIPDLYMHFSFDLTLVRFITNNIVSSKMRVKTEFAVNPEASTDDVLLAWNKIDYWLANLNQAVVIWASNKQAVDTMIDPVTFEPRFANAIMITPGEPTEEVMAYVLQAKLTALGTDAVGFGTIEIESDETNGIRYTVLGDPQEMLPGMNEWMGMRNWFKEPWWNRDDGSMLDAQPPEDADLKDTPEWAYNWSFLEKKSKPSGVVISARFKPKLITDTEE